MRNFVGGVNIRLATDVDDLSDEIFLDGIDSLIFVGRLGERDAYTRYPVSGPVEISKRVRDIFSERKEETPRMCFYCIPETYSKETILEAKNSGIRCITDEKGAKQSLIDLVNWINSYRPKDKEEHSK